MVSHQSVVTHSPMSEPWQASALPLSSSHMGLGLLAGLFTLSLAFLWLRVLRLTRLVKRRDHQLVNLSSVDPLTGLVNRQRLERIGDELLAIARRSVAPDNSSLDDGSLSNSSPSNSSSGNSSSSNSSSSNSSPNRHSSRSQRVGGIAVLYLDLDRFKAFNDTLGYEIGDELLQRVVDRLRESLRAQDTLARIGGDEFAILLYADEHDEGPYDDCLFAEQLFQSLNRPFFIQGQRVKVSASVGIASATSTTTHLSQLLRQANIAMSQAKLARSTRKDCIAKSAYIQGSVAHSHYAVFHPLMQSEMLAQAKLRQALKRAIARKELRVHYQPIVDLQNAQTIGFEALVRWQHPTRGLLSPNDFLPLAEEMGLTVAIDRWVMQTACQQLSLWCEQSSFCSRTSLSVNLSAVHLSQPDLVAYIQELLSQYPIAPHQLNVEITESVMIADPEGAIATLRQLRLLGVRVSLDDFGTGYSSLGYLLQFPVDVLKIDRSFVRSLGTARGTTSQDDVIVRAILALAEGLDIHVVAEGIECDEQLSQLKQMRCSYGQGNLFSKPINAPSAHALLSQK